LGKVKEANFPHLAHFSFLTSSPETGGVADKRVFLLAIQSHLYKLALRFLFLQTHATSYSFNSALLYTVKEEGGKLDKKPNPLPRNPYRNQIMPRNLKEIVRHKNSAYE
jgi:hypothetical protein